MAFDTMASPTDAAHNCGLQSSGLTQSDWNKLLSEITHLLLQHQKQLRLDLNNHETVLRSLREGQGRVEATLAVLSSMQSAASSGSAFEANSEAKLSLPHETRKNRGGISQAANFDSFQQASAPASPSSVLMPPAPLSIAGVALPPAPGLVKRTSFEVLPSHPEHGDSSGAMTFDAKCSPKVQCAPDSAALLENAEDGSKRRSREPCEMAKHKPQLTPGGSRSQYIELPMLSLSSCEDVAQRHLQTSADRLRAGRASEGDSRRSQSRDSRRSQATVQSCSMLTTANFARDLDASSSEWFGMVDSRQVPIGFNNMLKKRRQTAEKQAERISMARGGVSRISQQPVTVTSSWEYKRRVYFPTKAVDMFFAAVLITHIVFIGFTVQYKVSANTLQAPQSHKIVNYIYTGLFTLEVLTRLAAEGCAMFAIKDGSDWKWNWFDVVVVAVSYGEIVLQLATANAETEDGVVNQDELKKKMTTVNLFRAARLARLMRVIRIVRFIKPLRVLVNAISQTLRSVFWALTLLAILLYGFAIAFTSAASEYIIDSEMTKVSAGEKDKPEAEDVILLRDYFGSIPKTMFTLFKCFCNGMSWADASHALGSVSEVYVALFLVFVAFVYFAVLNVVTGFFCQSAIDSAAQDKEDAIELHLKQKMQYTEMLRELFKDIDEGDDSAITIDEFEKELGDPNSRMHALFRMLEIDIDDAWKLFLLLDADGDGAVTLQEFMDGCLSMRGNARGIHVAQILYENKWMMMCLKHLAEFIHEQGMRHTMDQTKMMDVLTRFPGFADKAGSTEGLLMRVRKDASSIAPRGHHQ